MSDAGPDDPSGEFCREVERAFVARRGGASVVSPADWQLILDWERRGIPLPVVVEGIGRAFDRRASASGRLGLRACAGAVEAAFAGHRRRRAGLPETAAPPEPPAPPGPDESGPAGATEPPPARTARAGWLPSAASPSPPSPPSSPSPSAEGAPRGLWRKSGERSSARSADRGGVRGGGAPLPAKDGGGNRAAIPAAGPWEERPAAKPNGDLKSSGRGAEGGALFPRAVPARLLALAAELRAWRPDASAVEPGPAAAAASLAAGRIAGLAASLSPGSDSAGPKDDPPRTARGAARPKAAPGPEARLEAVEEALLRSLAEALRPAASAAITAAAAEPLAAYRRRMPPAGYREALAAAVRRRLPRALALPPLRLDDRA